MNNDIRWIQRLANFENVMNNLRDGVEEAAARILNKLKEQGVIQTFYFKSIENPELKEHIKRVGKIF
ncbi:MAG TPA: hypothetical protein VHO70_20885 [Chitinispirillaceae bacterium]|nr:hypothetical protein [Chitinispirillaceae bacterium]